MYDPACIAVTAMFGRRGKEAGKALVGYIIRFQRTEKCYIDAAALHQILKSYAPSQGVICVNPVYTRVVRVPDDNVRELPVEQKLVYLFSQRAAVDYNTVKSM